MTAAAQASNVVPFLVPANPELFSQIDRTADRLRRERAEKIRAAMQARDVAVAAMEAAKRAERDAHHQKLDADELLRHLIAKGERVVIGNSLVTVNEHGGLTVEPVMHLGLL